MSFKTPRYRGKAEGDSQNPFIGAAWSVKRWLRLLAQQSSRTERSQNRWFHFCSHQRMFRQRMFATTVTSTQTNRKEGTDKQ
jgi:hypothetical protein